MTGPDEGCVRAIWVALTLWSLLDAKGSVLCPDVKHRGGSHGVEVNVLFWRHTERARKTEYSLALSLPLCVLAVSRDGEPSSSWRLIEERLCTLSSLIIRPVS